MSRFPDVIFVVALSLSAIACENFHLFSSSSPTDIDVRVGQDNSPGAAEPSPTPASPCGAVIRVEISADSPIAVGDVVPIDATPFAASGERPDSCNLASGIEWSATGPCGVSPTNVYSPILTATGSGLCRVAARVENAEGAAEVSIQ